MRDFYQEIIDIIGSGGEDCCVVPLGDAEHESADHATVQSVGQGGLDNLNFTYVPSARTNNDVPVEYARNQLRFPFMPWNTTDEGATTPDAAAWFRDDAAGEALSFGALVQISDTAAFRVVWGNNNTGSWELRITDTERLALRCKDVSAAVVVERLANAGSTIPIGVPVLIGSAYDGSGGVAAMDGAVIYIAGAAIASSATNNASYVGMENQTGTKNLGSQNGSTNKPFGDKIAVPYWTGRNLSAVEMLNLNDIYVAMQRAQRSPQLAGIF